MRPIAIPPRVEIAIGVDPLVELPTVRAMEWVDCEQKVIVTYSERSDKVKQSTFFLTPGPHAPGPLRASPNRVLKNNILVQRQGGCILRSAVYTIIYEHSKNAANTVFGPKEQFFNSLD